MAPPSSSNSPTDTPRVVILGGGFAGLRVAKSLRKAPVTITLIDRENHHLFQPLLYQVATATLSPADIAQPIRKILSPQRNARVVLGEVSAIDAEAKTVAASGVEYPFDWLAVATGAMHSYFGHDEWSSLAPGLKTIDDALDVRRRFLLAFEKAELATDEAARQAALTFIVVGGGPTGVEVAGAIAEIAHRGITRDFRLVDTRSARVILVQGGPRLLEAYSQDSSDSAKRQLESMGVEVQLDTHVTHVDDSGVQAGQRRIDALNVIWAAGVVASPVGAMLPAPTTESGQVEVIRDLSIEGHPNIFVCGDLAHVLDRKTGRPVPGVAQGAIQMGRHVGRIIADEARARCDGVDPPNRPTFHYRDKGSLATIGRARAVADIWGRHFGGTPAWLLWAIIHVVALISFRSRIMVLLSWIWTYFFFDRGARLITGARARDPAPR